MFKKLFIISAMACGMAFSYAQEAPAAKCDCKKGAECVCPAGQCDCKKAKCAKEGCCKEKKAKKAKKCCQGKECKKVKEEAPKA